MAVLARVADAIDRPIRAIATAAVWLMPLLAFVICVDVVTRKFGIYIPALSSSRLQELEWHIHAVLFSLWIGFAYLVNAHPRVDTLTGGLPIRVRAWLELAGCILFGIPYCVLLTWWGAPFFLTSLRTREGPEFVGGLPERWIVKGLFVFGLLLLLLAVISTTLRLVAFLRASKGECIALPIEIDAPTV